MLKIFAIAMALSLSSCPGAIGKALRLWGYTEVRPASIFWEPGTLVYVKHSQPFEAGTICPAEMVLGADYKPRESLTMNADMSRISKKGVTLDVEVANLVNANNATTDMSDLKMTLNNGHIFEVTDYDIESRRGRMDPACLVALKKRQAQGHKITMIASALRADVVYNVTWDKSSKLSLAAKMEALSNLSASLGADANPQTVHKINGTGLYWGIRDDVYLAFLLLGSGEMTPVEPASRIIPTSLVVSTLPSADPQAQKTPPGAPSADVPGNTPKPQSLPEAQERHRALSHVDEDGVVTYELDDELPEPRFALIPADPSESWDGVELEPHQGL